MPLENFLDQPIRVACEVAQTSHHKRRRTNRETLRASRYNLLAQLLAGLLRRRFVVCIYGHDFVTAVPTIETPAPQVVPDDA